MRRTLKLSVAALCVTAGGLVSVPAAAAQTQTNAGRQAELKGAKPKAAAPKVPRIRQQQVPMGRRVQRVGRRVRAQHPVCAADC